MKENKKVRYWEYGKDSQIEREGQKKKKNETQPKTLQEKRSRIYTENAKE